MQTSYFGRATSKSFKDRGLNLVSIATGSPRWYSGRRYAKLFPGWELVRAELTQEEYEKRYRVEVLNKLDPLEVYEELGEDAVLLCWEKYDDILNGTTFCHRHIVAKWLEEELWLQYDIDVKIGEMPDDKGDLKKIAKNEQMKMRLY